MRSGSSSNHELELIYNDLLTSMGSAYSDNTQAQTLVQLEIFAYAKAIYFLHQQVKEARNNSLFGSKLTYNLDEEVKNYNIEFLKSDSEKLLFIALIQSCQSLAINEKSLTTILKTLAPISFLSLYTNNTSNEVFEPNYILYTEGGLTQPYDGFFATYGYSINNGVSWTQAPMLGYRKGSTYNSSMNIYRINVQKTEQFSYEIQKITAFLNVVLPAYISFTFQTNTSENLMDGYSFSILNTATVTKTYHLNLTVVSDQTFPIAYSIPFNVITGNTPSTVLTSIYNALTSSGFIIVNTGTQVNIMDYRIESIALTTTPTPIENTQLITLNISNFNTQNIILDGFHAIVSL